MEKELLDLMLSKQEKIAEDISEIKVTLAENTVQLKEHIRRTNLLESEIKDVKKSDIETKTDIKSVKLLFRILASTGVFGLVGAGILNLIKLLHS